MAVDMSRRKDLAGQTVSQGGMNVTYDENGYAVKASNYNHDLYTGTDKGVKAKSESSVTSSSDRSSYGGSQYDQYFFSDNELATAADLRNQAQSGQATWDAVHDYVESIRKQYGYSGGADGSEYNALTDLKSWNEINGLLDDITVTQGMLNNSLASKNLGATVTSKSGVTGISSVYDQQFMSAADVAAIEYYSQIAKEAAAKGDNAAVSSAHNAAEAIRAKYGYSGGQYGDEYLPLGQNTYGTYSSGGIASYDSQYSSQIDSLLNQILNREPFSYDYTTDPTYLAYADQYKRLGDRAREDTLGDIAALNGGYASSWAASAASQAQNDYNQQLSDIIPALYDAAYGRYMDGYNMDVTNLGLVQGVDNTYYDRYRDTVSDYQWQQQFDYNAYRDSVADSQWQQSFDWNKTVDQWNMSNTEATQKFDQLMSKWQMTGVADAEVAAELGVPVGATTESYYFNKAQLALDQAKLAQSNKIDNEANQNDSLAQKSIIRNAQNLINQTSDYSQGAQYILSAVTSANEFYTIGSQAGIPTSILDEVFDSFYDQALKSPGEEGEVSATRDKTYWKNAAIMSADPVAFLESNKSQIAADGLDYLDIYMDIMNSGY